MSRRFVAPALFLAAAVLLGAVHPTSDPPELVVHEWGTFTSIAGADGQAVRWMPQAGPTDLPCFVHRNPFNPKGGLWGTVRMETPVLYFYSPHESHARVRVQFHDGLITEWFPPATVTPAPRPDTFRMPSPWESSIGWSDVTVLPNAEPDFRVEPGASHYYAARRTDASPVVARSERERFLFYRGVGTFAPPIITTSGADGSVTIASTSGAPLGDIILFENRNGAIAFEGRHVADHRVTMTLAAPQDEMPAPEADLERTLIAAGLYAREARAMIDTWRDSWFEEGVRVFYVVPAQVVDAILPLEIEPLPTHVVRAFVGRLEVVTPTTQQIVRDALAASDLQTLDRYGRFLQAIGSRLTASAAPVERAMLEHQLQFAAGARGVSADRCR